MRRTSTPHGFRKIRLSDQLYEQLLALIIEGEFAEGSRLPSEMELADRFSLSRPVVRDALARLREERVISSRQGAGSFVARRPPPVSQVYPPIQSLEDIRACFEFRAAVEGEAAFYASLRRSEADLAAIESAVRKLADAVARKRPEMAIGFAFHQAVAIASHNPFFVTTFELIQDQLSFAMTLARNLSLVPPADRHAFIVAEHREIFASIRERRPEEARARMRGHIMRSWQRIRGGNADGSEPEANL